MTDTTATLFIVAVAVAAVTSLAGFLVARPHSSDEPELDVWDG